MENDENLIQERKGGGGGGGGKTEKKWLLRFYLRDQ